ncbi:MAG TPA: ribonuclease HI family protein [Roseiflexaceae bacterium]|nr:ribonuclease HI family protein [Roseiflexaceae bacterium]
MSAQPLVLQVDGTPGVEPRGTAGIGIVVRSAGGQVLRTRCVRAPAWTNTEAEYQAVIAGLTFVLRAFPGAPVRCMTDSRVVVDQLSGRAAVRVGPLQPLFTEAQALMRQFAAIELLAIPRELNQLADALAWEALRGRRRIVRFGAKRDGG